MKIYKIFKIALILSLIMPVSLLAETKANNIVERSLSECLEIGLSNNLDIKIANLDAKIAGEGVLLSEALFDTIIAGKTMYTDDRRDTSSTAFGTKNLQTEYAVGATKMLPTGTELIFDYSDTRDWTNSVFVDSNPLHTSEISLSVKQSVLKNFFGYIDQKTLKIAKLDAEISNIYALDRIEDSVARIEKAYWRLGFSYKNLALRNKLLRQAEELYNTFTSHLKTGIVESTELYEVEANMRIRKAELLVAQNDLINASNSLKLLLNEDGSFLILPKNKLEIINKKADFVESINEALIANRDYDAKKKELTSKKINLKLKRNSLWPEVDLIGTFALNGVDRKFTKAQRELTSDKSPLYSIGVEFSMPLENSQARGEYNQASFEKERAILELIKVEKDLITNVDAKVRAVNLYLENAKRWTKIREIQEAKFKEEETKLQYGRSSSKTITDYQNDLVNASIREYVAILAYYDAYIDLENEKDTLIGKVGLLDNEDF